jgi:hypothetical protein
MQIDHDCINRNGWHQGSVFTIEDSTQILAETPRPQPSEIVLSQGTRLMVVSHSCDVVSRRAHELQVEVCPAIPLSTGQGLAMYGHGRDPRCLRLPLLLNGQPVMHELHAPLRFYMQRAKLQVLKPDTQAELAEREIGEYTYWLAARVRRRAFPDAFDRRLYTDNTKRIRKILSKPGVTEHVEALLYSLSSSKELPDETPYEIKVVLLANATSLKSVATVEALETAKEEIIEILSARPGIILINFALAADTQLTVAQYKTFSSWGFEDLSLEEESDLPPGI